MVYKRRSDRDNGNGIQRGEVIGTVGFVGGVINVYKEGIDRDIVSRSQAVADETSTGNITTWRTHLHQHSKLTPT